MSLRQLDAEADAMAGKHTADAGAWSSSSTGSNWSWSGYAGRCSIACLLLTFAPVWVFLVAARVPPGLARFCLAAPALAALLLAPFCFDYELEPLTIMAIAYLSERLPATKVLAFCLGRGLLQEHLPTCSLPEFTAITLCPLVPVATGVPKTIEQLRSSMRQTTAAANALKPTSPQHLRSLLATKTWIMAAVAVAVQLLSWSSHAAQHCNPSCGLPEPTWASASMCQVHHMASMLGQVLQALHFGKLLLAVGMYCAMAGMVEFTVLCCQMMCARGMSLAAPFNAPYAATCMSEFWSVRWNIPQSQLLKALVYDPIMEGSWVKADDGSTITIRRSLFVISEASPTSTASKSPFANISAAIRSSLDRRSLDIRRSIESNMSDGLDRRAPQLELSAAPSLSLPSSGGLGTNRRGTTRRALAVLATFAFSGIEHLVFYWYINRTIYVPWMLFFSGHGLLVIAESSIRRALAKRRQQQQGGQLTPAPSEPLPPTLSTRPSRLGPMSTAGAARSVSQANTVSQDDATSQISDQDARAVRKSEKQGSEQGQRSTEVKDTACCDRGDSSSSESSSLISTCLSETSSQAEPPCDRPGQLRDSFESRGKSALLSRPRQRHGKGAQVPVEPVGDEVVYGARSVRNRADTIDASRTSKEYRDNMGGSSSALKAHKPPQDSDFLQTLASISKQVRVSILAAVATLPQLLQQKAVCMALTLGLLHVTACMGFYGALHDEQLVARVGRSLCSMPQSVGSSMTMPGC